MTHWTDAENLAIYMFLNKYPYKTDEEIAKEIFENSFLKNEIFPTRLNMNTIKLHVHLLRKPEYFDRLVVPDYKNRDKDSSV
ncbi:hypothetical protein [Paenibacillus sp. An7]|uniref:hypothetical protein n=1 Tax=Paenibacillus sp. An7 TaxID=2689577 RepID=UPI00135A98A9|nr:hypothetical protein [Paenibacillus sp. An7]